MAQCEEPNRSRRQAKPKVWTEFAVWLLDDHFDGVIRFATYATQSSISQVAYLYREVLWQSESRDHFTLSRLGTAGDSARWSADARWAAQEYAEAWAGYTAYTAAWATGNTDPAWAASNAAHASCAAANAFAAAEWTAIWQAECANYEDQAWWAAYFAVRPLLRGEWPMPLWKLFRSAGLAASWASRAQEAIATTADEGAREVGVAAFERQAQKL